MQWVQPPARQIHILGALGLIETGQLAGQFGRMGGLDACFAAKLEKGL